MTMIRLNNQLMLSDVFEHVFNSPARNCQTSKPAGNIYENESNFVIELAVPGYTREDFSITVEDKTLSISANEKQHVISDEKFLRREFSLEGMKRNYALPKSVDTEGIGADYKDGILKITLPIIKEAKIRKEIQIS